MTEIFNLSTLCRCCHADGYFKSLSLSYQGKNDVEIYEIMLRETLGITISTPLVETSYTICDNCILKLRAAKDFKNQVLLCEQKFNIYCKNEQFMTSQDPVKVKVEFDQEGSVEQDDNSFHEDDDQINDHQLENVALEGAADVKTEYSVEVDIKHPIERVKNEGSDTDSEYENAEGPSTKKKLRTEFVHKKCVTTYSRQDFKRSETRSTDYESRRGSPLQIIGDVAIEHDSNQMEVEDDPTIDHIQKPGQIIGVRLNKAAKSSAERSREFRARKSLLKQQIKEQQESKKQAKTAAQRMREYRERKKLAKKIQASTSSPQVNRRAGPSTINSNSTELTRRGNPQSQQQIETERAREYRERRDDINIESNNRPGYNEEQSGFRNSTSTYDDISIHKKAHENFDRKFRQNPFGYSCTVCNRLWFKNDLKIAPDSYEDLLKKITNINNINDAMICASCKVALDKQNIPILSTYNGFEYPKIPAHLPKLDLVSERLISPRLPFMQIRRLRHAHGQSGIYGQVINVPASVDTMVNQLPRHLSDDFCIYVHIKKKRIHKSNHLQGLINKKEIKTWLQYLVNTPLYTHYNITINRGFLSDGEEAQQIGNIDQVSEDIPIEESLIAQQHTLLWNDEKYLRIAPGENNIPRSLLFEEHAEELSFPSIYLGQFRTFKEGIRVTPFMMVSSELRRTDRRAITPHHLLYIALKIMRLRIQDCLSVAFKHIGPNTNVTREQIESEEYINNCIESNLAFLRSIPNSTWYWTQRKKDLFAMIRQKGRPTAFMTLSANEIGWTDLIQLLYKLANNGGDISERVVSELSVIERSTLVNEDAVTCAIYFNKLVNVLLTVLQSKECSPFGRYRVAEYFKRIEFPHRGSPHAHILLWLENVPDNMIDKNNSEVVHLIDSLVSVSASQASGNIELLTHKHTFACYKKIVANKPQKCIFGAPFMPCRKTLNLTPMQKTEEHYQLYAKRYAEIRSNLESTDYNDIDDFYAKNNIQSDDEYRNILRAGITRPKVFYKRSPSEKWHNSFNPFIFNIMRSNMDFQIITEEYSCAAYVVEYVNKTSRGVSDLQRKIIEVMNEHPDFDIVDITRKMSVDMLNSVEMSTQEAAWYLLREPMAKSSIAIFYINTVRPVERQRIRKNQKELSELDENSTDIWKDDWFYKYQQRPDDLNNITLAQFVSKYYQKKNGVYAERTVPKVIRFRNYDIAQDYNEYKREMVTLHIPFRNEDAEILAEMKFINVYDENEALILERRKEFESNFDIEKMIEICQQLCREDGNKDDDETEIQDVANRFPAGIDTGIANTDEEKDSKKDMIKKKPSRNRSGQNIKKEPFKIDPALILKQETEKGVQYSCMPCGKVYENKKLITNHIRKVHGTPIKCEFCPKLLKNKSIYKTHLKLHSNPEYRCSQCKKVFFTNKQLCNHRARHRQEEYICDLCKKIFNYKATLRKHLLWHAGKNKVHLCDICGNSFNDISNLKIHIRAVHENLRPFKCETCSKTFKFKKHLKKHIETQCLHKGEKPYQCDKCPKRYADKRAFRTHTATHENKFMCRHCFQSFDEKDDYINHLKVIHRQMEYYPCNLCGKNLTSKYSLNRHIDSHNGIKNFGCDICSIKFSQKALLIRHNLRKHNPNVDPNKPILKVKCTVCKRFVKNLESHMSSHTDRKFSCDLCGRTYAENNALTRHKWQSHWGRTFDCDICGKKYAQNAKLATHKLKAHTLKVEEGSKIRRIRNRKKQHGGLPEDPNAFLSGTI